jgi:hypothetical protein
VGAAVSRRPEPAFRIGLQHESSEIRNRTVDGVHPRLPEVDDGRRQRVERVEAADRLRHREVDRERHPDAPPTEHLRQPRELRQEPVGHHERIGFHAVDDAGVHAD